ncbi:MAG: hypothetical protein L0I24_18550, partial [Pseudonocardia sp.]|nr:hypothetical protein [Pseudonocardia sp.]
MWMPGQAKRRAVKEAETRRAQMLAELEARREAERELAERESGKPARSSVSRVAVRTVFRARRLIAPFVLLVVLAALGWWGTAPDVSPVAPLALWLGGGAVAGRYRLRGRLHRAVERRYAHGCTAAGAVWLTGAAVFGPGALDSLLVAGWAVAALPWWWHHWPRPRTEPPPVEAGESIPEQWERYVADPGGPLAGAVLFHPDVTAHSQTWWVQLRRGRQDIGNARAALPKVATGLDKPMHRLLFDPVPRDEMPEERPSIIRMQYVVNSPIEETVYFDQPRWDGGRILLGPHADGDGEATWRLYTENSMWSGYVLGSTGAGKSRQVESVVLTARAMPVKPITIYLDGQAGASSPTLWEHATWRGGPDESLDILAALERGLRIRQKWNVVHHLAGFTPGFCPDGAVEPLIPVLVVGDEWHKIARLAPDRWADLAREQRKCGFGILAASQETSLAAFGGSDALRSSLITGNGIAMRTTSRMSAGLFPGLGGEDGLNPVDFPQLPGYGYKIAALGSGERTTAYRARFLPDDKDRAKAEKAGTPLPVPTVGEWFARTCDAELDEMTARAFGPVFLDRHRLAEESTRAAWDEINGVTPAEAEPGERVVADKPGRTADVIVAVLDERGPTSRADLE